jgi:hypothetical protein
MYGEERIGVGSYCSCLKRDREGVDDGVDTRLSSLTVETDRFVVGSFLTLATFCGVATGLDTLLSARLRLTGDDLSGVFWLACCVCI